MAVRPVSVQHFVEVVLGFFETLALEFERAHQDLVLDCPGSVALLKLPL